VILILTGLVKDRENRHQSERIVAAYALRVGEGVFIATNLRGQLLENMCDNLADVVLNDAGTILVCPLCDDCDRNMRWLEGSRETNTYYIS